MKKIIIIILMVAVVLSVGVYCIIDTLIDNSNNYSNTGSNYSTNNNSYYDSGNYNSGSSYGGSSYSGGYSSGGSYSSSYDRDADYVAGQFGVSSDRVKDSVGALADAIR